MTITLQAGPETLSPTDDLNFSRLKLNSCTYERHADATTRASVIRATARIARRYSSLKVLKYSLRPFPIKVQCDYVLSLAAFSPPKPFAKLAIFAQAIIIERASRGQHHQFFLQISFSRLTSEVNFRNIFFCCSPSTEPKVKRVSGIRWGCCQNIEAIPRLRPLFECQSLAYVEPNENKWSYFQNDVDNDAAAFYSYPNNRLTKFIPPLLQSPHWTSKWISD